MSTVPHADLVARIHEAMSTVIDPEIRRPITELDMVKSVSVASDDDNGAHVVIAINLTTEGCPMKSAIEERVSVAAQGIDGVARVTVELGAMTPDQREALKVKLRGSATPVIPFTQPGNLTRIYAIASGKGGVGKSTVTANLAAAMAAQGLSVGVIDADIYGFSIPRLLGARSVPTKVGSMLLPPIAHEVKVVSIGMFVPAGQPVVWRGPMLHRALEQFLTDVYWGDLDVLLLDLPPGTGDIAISVAQLLPHSEILTITTPQLAASEVAERAGSIALQTRQPLAGVIENMSWYEQPDGTRVPLFGQGGGQQVAASLTTVSGRDVPLLGQIPLDMTLREDGDEGTPVVLAHPTSPAAVTLREIASQLGHRERGLAGMRLTVTPVSGSSQ